MDQTPPKLGGVLLTDSNLPTFLSQVQDFHLPYLPDRYKAFDVVKVVEFLEADEVRKDARILDMGAYQSPSLWALHSLGYTNLYGIDVDPDIYNMPFYTNIRYSVRDMVDTHFPDNFYDACIAMSSVEHIPQRLPEFLNEASRITRTGGLLLLTTDFSFERVDTGRAKPFGMDWTIFDYERIKLFVTLASSYGFSLISELPTNQAASYPVHWKGREYTFIFLAFRLEKNVPQRSARVCILYPGDSHSQDGIYEYARVLGSRLGAPVLSNGEEIPDTVDTVVIEAEGRLFENVGKMYLDERLNWILDCHSFDHNMLQWLNRHPKVTLIVRDSWMVGRLLQNTKGPIGRAFNLVDRSLRKKGNEARKTNLVNRILARVGKLGAPKLNQGYTVVPHVLYAPQEETHRDKVGELQIGSFGFAFRHKHFDDVIRLAQRLQVRCKIVATINNVSKGTLQETTTTSQELERFSSDTVSVITGFYKDEEILSYLGDCTHIIFAHESRPQVSGSIRFAAQAGVPIIAQDSFQSREAGCLRVPALSAITKEYLTETRDTRIRFDDGLNYYKVLLNV
jgi:SAM-dependent methyltransferase